MVYFGIFPVNFLFTSGNKASTSGVISGVYHVIAYVRPIRQMTSINIAGIADDRPIRQMTSINIAGIADDRPIRQMTSIDTPVCIYHRAHNIMSNRSLRLGRRVGVRLPPTREETIYKCNPYLRLTDGRQSVEE